VLIWVALFLGAFPLSTPAKAVVDAVRRVVAKMSFSPSSRSICPNVQLPFYLLIVLGCYALYCVGWALFVFGDPGTASADLAKVRS